MKALALFSGGLDSILSAKLIKDQGIDVTAIYINMGFDGTKDKTKHLKNVCQEINVKLEILDLRQRYLDEILFNPKHGYGSAFNPCIDCHGFMFKVLKELMPRYGASFLISGEVLGQRPMSQRKDALNMVRKLAINTNDEDEDIILRPLSAKLLPPTKPERLNWVNREKLLGIEGRGRGIQLQLVKDLKIINYESPAGGCMLTEKVTSARIKDFLRYEKKMDANDINVLKFGRHLRLPEGGKLIIGRHQEDNNNLKLTKSSKFYSVNLIDTKGPYSLISKELTENDKKLAIEIVLTYAKTNINTLYKVSINNVVFEGYAKPSKDFIQQYML